MLLVHPERCNQVEEWVSLRGLLLCSEERSDLQGCQGRDRRRMEEEAGGPQWLSVHSEAAEVLSGGTAQRHFRICNGGQLDLPSARPWNWGRLGGAHLSAAALARSSCGCRSPFSLSPWFVNGQLRYLVNLATVKFTLKSKINSPAKGDPAHKSSLACLIFV